MPDLADLYNGSVQPVEAVVLEAVAHDSAISPTDEIRAKVPGFDPNTATDPMQWTPYVTGDGVFYPKVGDRVVIAYPDEGPPIILAWWPKAEHPDISF